MKRPDHWTAVYRTDALSVYETEAPIFVNPPLTRQELDLAEAVARQLEARLRSPVLDLACGPGRHTRMLTADGHAVVGTDHSEGLLAIAAGSLGRGPSADGRPPLVCADLRDLPFAERSFNAALLLGKSFGYFSDEENLEILSRVEALLRGGGFFCLQLPDREPYLASMRPVETETRQRDNGDRLRSEYRCRWEAESSRLEVHESHVLVESGATFWEGTWDVRLYRSDEIAALLYSAGFRQVVVHRTRLVEAQGAKGDVLIVGARN